VNISTRLLVQHEQIVVGHRFHILIVLGAFGHDPVDVAFHPIRIVYHFTLLLLFDDGHFEVVLHEHLQFLLQTLLGEADVGFGSFGVAHPGEVEFLVTDEGVRLEDLLELA